MSTIQHRIRIKSTKPSVYKALSTIDGLSSWWTSTTDGKSEVGETINFRFGEGLCGARVTTLSAERVSWTVENAHPDWIGTNINFAMEQIDDQVHITFTHSDWREQNDFYGHCSMKWAVFLMSLRDQVESGEGRPFPRDIGI